MDDQSIDDFLAEISSSPTPSSYYAAITVPSNDSALDNELDSIFATVTITSSTASTDDISGSSSTNNTDTSNFNILDTSIDDFLSAAEPVTNGIDSNSNGKNDFDLLSWLGESPLTSPSAAGSAAAPAALVASNCRKESNGTVPSIDTFFDEIFGPDAIDSLRVCSSPSSPRVIAINYEQQLHVIINSSFPNVNELKKLIIDAGYIPTSLRHTIWSLLLNRSITEDEEIKTYRPSAFAVSNQKDIEIDCDAIVNRFSDCFASNDSNSSIDQVKIDMYNILVLFCVRRDIEYNHLYCNLLLPFIVEHNSSSNNNSNNSSSSSSSSSSTSSSVPSKALASSCFYTFATKSIPLFHLQPASMDVAINTIHFWLRLLLLYHNPVLAHHFDRVLPGWELPISGLSALESSIHASNIKSSADLDQLEKELGFDTIDSFVGNDNSNSSTSSASMSRTGFTLDDLTVLPIESAQPDNRSGGCIPSHWICGLFSGSLTPEQSSYIIDWALVNDYRYAGLFLTVSLFEIFSDVLLTMTGGRIRDWIDDVVNGRENWHQILRYSQCKGSSTINTSAALSPIDFVRGWIYATTKVQRSTPRAMHEAISTLEAWVMDKEKHNCINCNNNGSSDNDILHDNTVSSKNGIANVLIDEFDVDSTIATDTSITATTTAMLESFHRRLSLLGTKREGDGMDKQSESVATAAAIASSTWVHDRKTEQNTMILWSNAAEVIPCICTNKCKPVLQQSIMSYFYCGAALSERTSDGTSGSVGGTGSVNSFPQPDLEQQEKPFYFGLDCRTETEKELGHFPKGFSMDPASITDSDCISNLLLSLEPLADTVHLCIIGSGEAYVKYIHRNASSSSIQLSRALADHNARLNAVAMFFMKKGFKYVSILDGGFMEGARYLKNSITSLNIGVALIDGNFQLIDMILGEGSASNTAASTAVNGTSTLVDRLSSARASVGSFISTYRSKLANDSNGTIGSSSSSSSSSSTSGGIEGNGDFLSWGKKMLGSSSLESIMKLRGASGDTDNNCRGNNNSGSHNNVQGIRGDSSSTKSSFVIDDEDDDDEDGGSIDHGKDPSKISISRTEAEREQALALHRLAGLKKGDSIRITKDALPGAVLFPAIKYKEPATATGATTTTTGATATATSDDMSMAADPTVAPSVDVASTNSMMHRFLVVSRERFLVLDSGGLGLGSDAIVKSNHHLTELLKMTFRKKDPELVTLYFLASSAMEVEEVKTRQYRVTKREEFVSSIQKNMKRFKE